MNKVKGIRWQDKTVTLTLSELDQRAIRAFVVWLEELEANGTLEMYEYQQETLNTLKQAVTA